MRKIVLVLFLLILPANLAHAHPPSDIISNYDSKTGRLQLTIKHKVTNPARHYVEKVIIKSGNEKLATIEFDNQKTRDEQIVIYDVPKSNIKDRLIIEAGCSIHGSLKKEISLP